MKSLLKISGVFFVLLLLVGTGQLLVAKGPFTTLWQFFWVGLVIWIWGYIILMRMRESEKLEEEEEFRKDVFAMEHKRELDKLKISAVAALIAITFFYFSIYWLFKDDLFIATIVLLITFAVSISLQNKISELIEKGKDKDQED